MDDFSTRLSFNNTISFNTKFNAASTIYLPAKEIIIDNDDNVYVEYEDGFRRSVGKITDFINIRVSGTQLIITN